MPNTKEHARAREEAPAIPRRRGRPPGSRNKPKPIDPTAAKADRRLKPRTSATAPPSELPPTPPGLLEDLQAAMQTMSPRPCPAAALAGTLALLAAVCGSTYSVASAPLGLYLACAGEGGEEAAAGVARMVAALATLAPTIADVIGPTTVGQPSTVLRHFARTPSQACAWRGGTAVLRSMASDGSREDLVALLHELWSAPILTQALVPDLRRPVARPALSILACGSAADLKDARAAVDSPAHRFLCLQSSGSAERVDHPQTAPLADLVADLFRLFQLAQQVRAAGAVISVQITAEARPHFDALDEAAGPIRLEIAQRLAALAAVAENGYEPTVTAELAAWAIQLVQQDAGIIAAATAAPDPAATLAAQRARQRARVLDRLRHYQSQPWSFVARNALSPEMHKARICPLQWLSAQLAAQTAFASDPAGGQGALKRVLAELIESGEVVEVPTSQMKMRFGRSARAFLLTT